VAKSRASVFMHLLYRRPTSVLKYAKSGITMNNESLVKKWHRDIMADAERKLGRYLEDHEKASIRAYRILAIG